MIEHRDSKILPFTAEQLYALVFDVGSYPQFLPWCLAARVYNQQPLEKQDGAQFDADLVIGFKHIREKFSSRVTGLSIASTQDIPQRYQIESKLIKGPFSHLLNHWQFVNCAQGCEIQFSVRFAFHAGLLSALLEPIFLQAQRKILTAFEQRAFALYSPLAAQN